MTAVTNPDFRAARERAGLTQRQLAKALRVSPTAICRYELDGEALGADRARFGVKYLRMKARRAET